MEGVCTYERDASGVHLWKGCKGCVHLKGTCIPISMKGMCVWNGCVIIEGCVYVWSGMDARGVCVPMEGSDVCTYMYPFLCYV